jgi:hypothetical protein
VLRLDPHLTRTPFHFIRLLLPRFICLSNDPVLIQIQNNKFRNNVTTTITHIDPQPRLIGSWLESFDEGVELFDEIWEKVYSAEQRIKKESTKWIWKGD